MLVLKRKLGEEILIGEGENLITIQVVALEFGRVRLGITAPQSVQVDRKEVREAKQAAQEKH